MPTVSYRKDTFIGNAQANGFEPDDQFGPDVVGLDNGGFAVVYGTDNTSTPGNDFPLLTFYDSDFARIGSFSIPYDDTDIFMIGTPTITKLNNGNVVLTWDEGASGDNDLLGQVFSPTGVKLGANFVVGASSSYIDPKIAPLADGGFVVSWEHGASDSIRSQRFDATGTGAGIEFHSELGEDVHVAGLDDGGYVLTYTRAGIVYGKIMNDDDTVRAAEFSIGTFGTNDQSAVTALPNGNWAVVYKDTGWTGDGISLHIYDPNGVDLTSFIRVDVQEADIETDPDITVLDNGFLLVTWTDPTSSGDIRGRLFDQSGNAIQLDGADDFTVTGSPTADTNSAVSTIDGGDFVTVWADSFNDSDGDRVSMNVSRIIRTTVGDGTGETLIGDEITDEVFAGGGNDNVQGRDGDDSLFGGDGNDSLFGQDGDDSLVGGNGLDSLSGADGDDTLVGNASSDTLFGQNGNDSLLGGDQSDMLFGQAGADTLLGGLGNDELNGGTGNDSLHGGDGADIINGSLGSDTLIGSTGNDTMNGGNGNDSIEGGNGADSIQGTLGADTIDGGAQDDFINGGNGLDVLLGGTGNDAMFGGINNDVLLGEDGNDLMASGDGNDSLFGGNGNDSMFGGAGNDFLDGDAGDDLMTGVGGDDTLGGDSGNDTLIGGAGNDTFFFLPGWEGDTFNDFDSGVGITDVINLSSMGPAFDTFAEVIAASTDLGSSMTIDFGGGDFIILLNTNIADLVPDDFVF